MKQRIEQIIQNLSTCKDRDLFYEQLKILKHSEIEFRKGQISYKIKKLSKAFSNQAKRGIGSIISLLFAILWFFIIFPYKIIEISIMIIKLPFQLHEHEKIMKDLENHIKFKDLSNKF